MSLLSCAYAVFAVASHLWQAYIPPGWASTTAAVAFVGGVQLLFLGLIAEYVGQIFDEVKGGPATSSAPPTRSRLTEPAPDRALGAGASCSDPARVGRPAVPPVSGMLSMMSVRRSRRPAPCPQPPATDPAAWSAKARSSHAPKLPGLLECAECGFITADAQSPTRSWLKLYGEDYFHGDEYADYVVGGPGAAGATSCAASDVPELQPEDERSRLYEVGAAYGFFLDEAKGDVRQRRGHRHLRGRGGLREGHGRGRRRGRGLPRDGLRRAGRHPVHVGHRRAPRQPGRVPASRPVGTSGPAGWSPLTTGDIDSLNARFSGRRWRMIHPPTHLHYFSRRTLTRLLDRAGFDVVHYETAGNARSIRGIAYAILVLRGKRQDLYDALTKLPRPIGCSTAACPSTSRTSCSWSAGSGDDRAGAGRRPGAAAGPVPDPDRVPARSTPGFGFWVLGAYAACVALLLGPGPRRPLRPRRLRRLVPGPARSRRWGVGGGRRTSTTTRTADWATRVVNGVVFAHYRVASKIFPGIVLMLLLLVLR